MAGRQFQPESQMASDIQSQNSQNQFTANAAKDANRTSMIGAGAGVAVMGAILI
jgi:hypothetical protein